jgi:hypothetical protein
MAAGRNAVINGGMDVWQRGTSIALSANTAVYSTDRFMAYSVAGNRTVSRQVTNDSTNLPFIQYATRLQRNNTNTETNQIRFVMSLETVNSIPLAGKSVVFSFYARAGANYSGGVLTNQVRTGTGTDQNLLTAGYTGGAYPSGLNNSATLTTTWQRFTYTGTTAGTTTEIGIEFNWTPTGTAGADDWVEITGVQLEAGSVATQFSRAGGTIQGEYAACRRYYRRTSANGTNQYSVVAQGSASNTTNGAMMVPFDVSMRIAPTVVDYSTLRLADGVGAWTITAVAIDTNLISADYGFINCTVASGLTQYRPLFIQSNASASAYLGFSAEL